jgi:hypothetical protein
VSYFLLLQGESNKMQRLKHYLFLSGLLINNYKRMFADCNNNKQKEMKLLGILHEKGMEGEVKMHSKSINNIVHGNVKEKSNANCHYSFSTTVWLLSL